MPLVLSWMECQGMRCESPNLKLAWQHSNTAPMNNAMLSGVEALQTSRSNATIRDNGSGYASRLSLHAVLLA